MWQQVMQPSRVTGAHGLSWLRSYDYSSPCVILCRRYLSSHDKLNMPSYLSACMCKQVVQVATGQKPALMVEPLLKDILCTATCKAHVALGSQLLQHI